MSHISEELVEGGESPVVGKRQKRGKPTKYKKEAKKENLHRKKRWT